jgi:hypothetical protein
MLLCQVDDFALAVPNEQLAYDIINIIDRLLQNRMVDILQTHHYIK